MAPVAADDFGGTPGTLTVPVNARPIDSERPAVAKQSSARWSSDSTDSSVSQDNAWKLRWRKPVIAGATGTSEPAPLAQSQASARTSALRATPSASGVRTVGWNEPTHSVLRDRSVQPAAGQVAPSDPFEEPYPGQGKTTVPIQNEAPAAPAAEAPPAQAPAPEPVPQPAGDDAAPVPPQPAPAVDAAPVPPRGPGAEESLGGGVRDDMACERNYNGRNCCADDEKCRLARNFVQQYKLTSIKLDITPSFTMTDNDVDGGQIPIELARENELRKTTARVWKDRDGKVLADGRFVDYRQGHVLVQTEAGDTRELPYNELSDDDLCFVTAWWSLPTECTLIREEYQPRSWLASTLTWKASSLCHKPLYFEEVGLERYGHSVGPIKQPFVSGAHFFGSLAFLPYQMGIHPPHECQYALGYYRPGSCAPWLVPPMPISVRGGLAQAGAMLGGVYAFP